MQSPEVTRGHSRKTWQVQPEHAGQRLDRYLVATLGAVSRTSVQQLIAEGGVLINGRASKAGYMLRPGDEVTMLKEAGTPRPQEISSQPLPLNIVYEDEDLLIINKVPGMVVHPAPGHYDDTLVNALLARYPSLQAAEGAPRPGIVHRLDRDTSGLLIVAKNARTQAALTEQMKRHEVVKRYLALVEGVVPLDSGSIDAPIGRDPRHRQQMNITATAGREARTRFRVLERFARHTLLLIQLETGRTHQIRVHLRAIGYPVAGDRVYGGSRQSLPLHRQFLHAYQLEFAHPTTGQRMMFEAPLPEDLSAILNRQDVL
jgi:23S rRNA pseudouridine1911/1915/1917 synthase